MDFDYRSLLMRYLAAVGRAKGVDFIPSQGELARTWFTGEGIEELNRLAEESIRFTYSEEVRRRG